MAFPASAAHLIPAVAFLLAVSTVAPAVAADRVEIEGFAIDRTEVTLSDFAAFADVSGVKTAAEREGGGHEWGGGWVRRPGWTVRTPFGSPPKDPAEPAVHVTWHEARDYCTLVGGRLPSRSEWERAAYQEYGGGTQVGFRQGQTYAYPTGETPEGTNTSAADAWPRHAPAGVTRVGINGLHDMGGNVWEWLADRDGDNALTAGGSWWYGAEKMQADAMQWKSADFYAVYIGFRCAYDL
jgi:formylglycine-generating enzyme required for sulfatase activity